LTPGTQYKFRVESRNSYGYSAYSDEFLVLCASKPDSPTVPTTSVLLDKAIFEWSTPHDNGATITGYTVFIRQHSYDGLHVYTEETTECAGTTSDVIMNTRCEIALTTLSAAPWNLALDESIWA